jgi:hypothetical protein
MGTCTHVLCFLLTFIATPIEVQANNVALMPSSILEWRDGSCKPQVFVTHDPRNHWTNKIVDPIVVRNEPDLEYVPKVQCCSSMLQQCTTLDVTNDLSSKQKKNKQPEQTKGLEECVSLTGKPALCEDLSRQ